MPIYEYQCRSCGKVSDVRHGFDEKNTETCPACGGELARRFSAAGIVFKGSGFYVNDSRKSSGSQAADGKGGLDSSSADGKKAEPAKAEGGSKTDGGSSGGSASSGGSSSSKGDTAAA